MERKAEVVFEASWEVCNKVGGIFTVIKSKILPMKEQYGDDYYLVGPYFPKKVHGIFEEKVAPEACKGCLDALKNEGIEVHYGTWVTKGSPNVFLIDFSKPIMWANREASVPFPRLYKGGIGHDLNCCWPVILKRALERGFQLRLFLDPNAQPTTVIYIFRKIGIVEGGLPDFPLSGALFL